MQNAGQSYRIVYQRHELPRPEPHGNHSRRRSVTCLNKCGAQE